MRDTRRISKFRVPFALHVACSSLLLLGASCASVLDRQLIRQFSRVGESVTVSYSSEAITNAIVVWSRALTNGYVLYDDGGTRRNHVSLRADPATLFMLRHGTGATEVWGKSDCLPSKQASYWADIIIRVIPVVNGNKVSVAIHGRHLVRGLVWNLHTYGFERLKAVDLPPCSQDERQVLDEIQLTLRKVGGHKGHPEGTRR